MVGEGDVRDGPPLPSALTFADFSSQRVSEPDSVVCISPFICLSAQQQCQHTAEIKDSHRREVAAEKLSCAYWRHRLKQVVTMPSHWIMLPAASTLIANTTF